MIILFKIICIVAMIASFVVPFAINCHREGETSYGEEFTPVKKRYTVIPFIASVILFVIFSSFVVIPTGYTGVRTTFGQIDESIVQNGFNWKIPFIQSIEKVNNKQQDITFNTQVWSETSERTAIFYEGITVTYQINAEKSAWVYANVSSYKETLVSQSLVASAIKSSSKGLTDINATSHSIIEPIVTENIQKSLDEKYGTAVVCINKVTINNADFEDSYNQAIAAKQQALLNAEQQAIENKRAIEKAEADAEVVKTNAEASAAAKLIAARADAEANALLEQSLTEQILRRMYIDKWNGQLPNVTTNDSMSMILPANN